MSYDWIEIVKPSNYVVSIGSIRGERNLVISVFEPTGISVCYVTLYTIA